PRSLASTMCRRPKLCSGAITWTAVSLSLANSQLADIHCRPDAISNRYLADWCFFRAIFLTKQHRLDVMETGYQSPLMWSQDPIECAREMPAFPLLIIHSRTAVGGSSRVSTNADG